MPDNILGEEGGPPYDRVKVAGAKVVYIEGVSSLPLENSR